MMTIHGLPLLVLPECSSCIKKEKFRVGVKGHPPLEVEAGNPQVRGQHQHSEILSLNRKEE